MKKIKLIMKPLNFTDESKDVEEKVGGFNSLERPAQSDPGPANNASKRKAHVVDNYAELGGSHANDRTQYLPTSAMRD